MMEATHQERESSATSAAVVNKQLPSPFITNYLLPVRAGAAFVPVFMVQYTLAFFTRSRWVLLRLHNPDVIINVVQ